MHSLLSDSELWDSFKGGDNKAFGIIYERHIAGLLSYGYRITADRQLIKDSIHDLFLHLWQHRHNLSSTDSVKFYLFRSLRNRIIHNTALNKETPEDDISIWLDKSICEPSTEDVIVSVETQQYQILNLKCAIEKLPQRQREAIQLRYFHDLSMDEIAELMQLNNQSLRNLLHRSITQLRSFFEMAGWSVLMLLKFF